MLSMGPSLWQVLRLLPEEERRVLLAEFGLPPDPSSFSSAFEQLTDLERIDHQLDLLSTDSRHFLSDLLLSAGYLSWEKAAKRPTPRRVLAELDRTGFIYHIEDRYLTRQIALPREFADILWTRLLARESQELAATTTTSRREEAVYDASPFFQDLFQLLSYARVEPLPLTRQGSIFKRVETKMVQKFWSADGESGLQRLRHLEWFARHQALLTYTTDTRGLVVDEDQAGIFFSKRPAERHQAWFDYGFESISYSHLPQLLAATAACLAPEQWLDLEKLRAWLSARGVLARETHVNLDAHLARLREVELWEGDRRRGRLTDAAYFAANGRYVDPVPGQALVQPTGEVMVPPESPWEERWAWDAVAELVRCDRMTVYRISKAGLERALDLDWQHQKVLTLMGNLSKSPIPPNVRSNLEDWLRQLTRHRILEATLVHSQSAADSSQVERALGSKVLFRLSSTDLVIAPGSGPTVIRSLNKAGIDMRNRIERPGYPAASSSEAWAVYSEPSGLTMENGRQPMAAHLIGLTPELPDYQSIQGIVSTAIRHGRPISVRHAPPGLGSVVEQKLIPYRMENGWIQGKLVSTPQLVTIYFQRILAVSEVPSR